MKETLFELNGCGEEIKIQYYEHCVKAVRKKSHTAQDHHCIRHGGRRKARNRASISLARMGCALNRHMSTRAVTKVVSTAHMPLILEMVSIGTERLYVIMISWEGRTCLVPSLPLAVVT